MRKRGVWFVVCLVLAVVLMLAACGRDNGSTPNGNAQPSGSNKASVDLPKMADVKAAPVHKLGETAKIGDVEMKVELVGARETVPGQAGSYLLQVTVKNNSSATFEVDPAQAVWLVDEQNLRNPAQWIAVPYPDRCSGASCLRFFDVELMEKYGWKAEQVLPYEAGPALYGKVVDPFPALVEAGKTKTGHLLVDTGKLPDKSGKEFNGPLYLVFGNLADQKAWVRFSLGKPEDLFKQIDAIGFTLKEIEQQATAQQDKQ